MKQSGEPMTEAMYYVLLALDVPAHGYQLMQSVSRISRGRVTIGPGTLYGLLARLTTEKLIEIVCEEGRRKIYAITEAGQKALLGEYLRLKDMVRDHDEPVAAQDPVVGAEVLPV